MQSMDEFVIYLKETNPGEFVAWLQAYFWKQGSPEYPYQPGVNVLMIYYDILGNQAKIGAVADRNTLVKVDENTEILHFENEMQIDNAIVISWLKVGGRLKVTIQHYGAQWVIPPVLDLLAEMGKDWEDARNDIWNKTIRLQTKKYKVEILHPPFDLLPDTRPGQPFASPTPMAEQEPPASVKQGAGQAEIQPNQSIGFDISGFWEVPVDWDILAAASDSCLNGFGGIAKHDNFSPTSASIIYNLHLIIDSSDLGTVEIRKLRTGLSLISISGVPLDAESLPDWDKPLQELQGKPREIILEALRERDRKLQKRRAQLKDTQAIVIKAYFARLRQENIWPNAPEEVQSIQAGQGEMTKTETDQANLPPWLRIPDYRWDRKAVEMWCNYSQNGEIARQVGLNNPRRVTNRLSELRKMYPDAGIPYDDNRNKWRKL
jgi:hypothetical protein